MQDDNITQHVVLAVIAAEVGAFGNIEEHLLMGVGEQFIST